jgi:SAM-dependent methyltransferase
MKQNKEDVFGKMLLDASAGLEIPEIVERDDHFLVSELPVTRYLSGYAQWPSVQQKAIEFARGRVLDVGCGAGRHSLYLQEKGFDVMGLDVSPGAIQLCRRRGLINTTLLSIDQISPATGKFDTLVLLENNFGLLESRNKAKRILEQFYLITHEQGRIIAETSDPYNSRDPDILEYQKQNRAKNRMSGQIRMRLRYRRLISDWFDYLRVSKSEMKELLRGTGWEIGEILEFDHRSYVAIIEKS